ncbi:MAG: tRNA-(ms[2]io[6]A)-hydroxylase [Thiolinea sp.]
MITLRYTTPPPWTETVLADFDAFLQDHAAAEKKASGMALSMVAHYPDKADIVRTMTDLAVEELVHFKQVVRLMLKRGLTLASDEKDPYINALRKLFRQGTELFMLDRLLIAGIIEARGYERFGLIAAALPPGREQRFYQAITLSEGKHSALFVELAHAHFPAATVTQRLDELLDQEADLCAELPWRAALH